MQQRLAPVEAQSGSQDEKDVRNDISVYEEGADLEGTLTYGTLFIEPQTQHMIDLFMKEHPGVKLKQRLFLTMMLRMNSIMKA